MRRRGRGTVLLAAAALLAVAGCAGARLDGGRNDGAVFRAKTGYRVTPPGPGWQRVSGGRGRADLELRHESAPAAMLANGVCDPGTARRSLDLLSRHLLFGLRERRVVENGDVPLNGHTAAHAVVDGRMRDGGERVRVESYVVKNDRCVYDLLYAASPEAFTAWRGDFQRFVESFATE